MARPPLLVALLWCVATLCSGCVATQRGHRPEAMSTTGPFLVLLGTAQDAGIPQAGAFDHPAWQNPSAERLVTCLGLVDPRTGERWMIDATPDFRRQLYELNRLAGPRGPTLSGVFLTHAHMGHYTGLMFLGHESMGARGVPVHAMPRMRSYLETNDPWAQLVEFGNIEFRTLAAQAPVRLAEDLTMTPILVPHRQEHSEVVGFRVEGPNASALFIPDIDSWRELDEWGVSIEGLIAEVDVAYLDGTFFANGEIPGRDMSGFPHPFISASLARFGALPASERAKIRFIHLNHTNPAQWDDSSARRRVEDAGMAIGAPLEIFGL